MDYTDAGYPGGIGGVRYRPNNTPEEADESRAPNRPLHPTRGTPRDTKDGSKDHSMILLAHPLSGHRGFL